jgi:hypothetical protein
MRLDLALKLIHEEDGDELKALRGERLMSIVSGMTGEEISIFLFEKNVKIFGGIDGYVADFLNKVKLNSMNSKGKMGAKSILSKMLEYPGISEGSKKRVEAALAQISNETAPAAGGKSIRKTIRKKRGLKRTRVRR